MGPHRPPDGGGSTPALTVVIPTRDRPHLLPAAVESALDQTLDDVEVIVVDDGSAEPTDLARHPRLRVLRRDAAGGNAAARNTGLEAARGRWITCLDDDDLLLPHHGAVALEAIESSSLPGPVGSLSALAVIGPGGEVLEVRVPPTRQRGRAFSLEPLEPGRSYNSKQTLVVEAEVLRAIGGWDEAFLSRTVTELFFRLNPVCSLVGVEEITYHLSHHDGHRISTDPALRQRSFDQLENKHRDLFAAHPARHGELLLDHALMSLLVGQRRPALRAVGRAARRSPLATVRRSRRLAGASLAGIRMPTGTRSGP